MSRRLLLCVAIACMAMRTGGLYAASLGTTFTYQGRVKLSGSPLNATADLQFSLWDAAGTGSPPTGGTQVGGTQTVSNVAVTGGLFTVELNAAGEFGPTAFNGDARWLQMAVRSPAGSGAFTTLSPRQEVTPAPYALFALGGAGSATNWTDNGDNVYLPTGNAGIGTLTPTAMLHLNRPYADTGLRFQSVRFQEGAPLSTAASAGAASASGAGQAWTAPDAARLSDDTRATVFLSAAPGEPDPNVSQPLELSSFGFSIPAQAVVVGIAVQIEAQSTCTCTDCDQCRVDGTLELLGGTGTPNVGSFAYPGIEGTVVLGGMFDGGGLSWTPAQVNASAFGVRLAASLNLLDSVICLPGLGCSYATCDCTGSGTADIDSVSITVYYYDAAVSSTPVDWTIGIPETTSALQISPTADFGTPVVHIDPTGHVGINTTAPGPFNLAVNGYAAKPGGGSWSSLSDERLKEDIKPMEGTLDKLLLSLHGYEFEYTDEAIATKFGLPGRQIGLMAQEVQKVFPDWVGTTEDGYLHVTERATTALMVEALRDLRAEKDRQIAAQANRIRQQQQEIESLQNRIKSLKEIEKRLADLETILGRSATIPLTSKEGAQ